MNAFAVLALVLPLPLVFVIHDAEEIIFCHRWMQRHRNRLEQRFPSAKGIIAHLAKLTHKAFAIAAAEELLVLLAATAYVLVDAPYCKEVWMAVFIVFATHLIVHLVQACAVRSYVPGLATSLILLPYAAYGIRSILLVMSALELAVWSILGVLMLIVNLRFAHWLGIKIGKP